MVDWGFIDDEPTADDTAVRPPLSECGDQLALTLLHHPLLERVGEVSWLAGLSEGRPIQLSRNEPKFAPPGGSGTARSLGDRRLSRSAHRISSDEESLVLQSAKGTGMVADGETVSAEGKLLSAAELKKGVVIELADRVTLLLHYLPAVVPSNEPPPRFGLVGDSPQIEQLRQSIHSLRDIEVPVLLRGESGTGKELVARAIHDHSPRCTQPFVAVNIATTPGSIAASQLFGHMRGAFTGAHRDSPGLFRQADGGTLLLDEIGDTPGDVQVALLRVLESGEILPVGGQGTHHVDVRLVAATDADLEQGVECGSFRRALLHRLSGFQINVAPLRERPDDIGRLFVHFLRQELEAIGEAGRLQPDHAEEDGIPKRTWIPASLVGSFVRYHWPGNVRELRNAVRQVVIGNRGSKRYELPGELASTLSGTAPKAGLLEGAAEPRQSQSPTPPLPPTPPPRRRGKPSDFSDAQIRAALEANGWRIAPTARGLGIARNSLLARIDKSDALRRPKDLTREAIDEARAQCGGDLAAMANALKVSEAGLKLRLAQLGIDV